MYNKFLRGNIVTKKLGFALGSGGSRGVSHIGFLKAMEEEGIKPDFISGVSMGAVVGSCYAKGLTIERMINIVKKLKPSDIFDFSLNPLGGASLLRSQKMQKKIKQFLGNVKFSELEIPFTCVATDVISGKKVLLGENKQDKVCEAVVASASIPSIFKPVSKDNYFLVDGGVVQRVPIQEVRDMGATVVVAVDVLGEIRPCDKKYNIFTLLSRVFEITDNEITEYKKKQQKSDLYLLPELGNMNQYKLKDIDFAIESGYKLGKENANKIKKLLAKE